MGESLMCDHCGGDAVTAELFHEDMADRCEECGFPGSVHIDDAEDEPSAWCGCSEEESARCNRPDCDECPPPPPRLAHALQRLSRFEGNVTPLEAARSDEWHSTIPVGAVVVNNASGHRWRIAHRQGYLYGLHRIRKDGERDQRYDVGMTAFLRCDEWSRERA